MEIIKTENEFKGVLEDLKSIIVYTNGAKSTIKSGTTKFEKIKEKLFQLFVQAQIMPAFSVALHELVMSDMQNGQFIELNFNSQHEVNELKFDSLLFRLEKLYGVNLMRKLDEKYYGRCIYLAFDEAVDLNEILQSNK